MAAGSYAILHSPIRPDCPPSELRVAPAVFMKSTASYPNQRVGIFVDVQNLYHSAKNLYRGRVNYAELIKHLVGDRQLIRAMAYVVKSEGIVETTPHPDRVAQHEHDGKADVSTEAAFFEALEKAGLELRMKDLQVWADGARKRIGTSAWRWMRSGCPRSST